MTPPTMKAVKLVKQVNRYSEGDDKVRECFQVVNDEPTPKPRFSQVLIRVQRAQINPSDTSFCQGRYGIKRDPPCIPGFEGCGIVVSHGGSPMAWRLLGKRVCFYGNGGGWAEYVVVDQSRCLAIGDQISWKNAAGGVVNPLTVMEMIRIAEEGGKKCMVATAGASSLTQQLIRVGKLHGISTIAIVRKQDQVALCEKSGAVVSLNSSAEDFVAKLEEACEKHRCNIAFDSVAGEVGGQVLSALREDGELHCYGFLSGKPMPVAGKDLIFKRKIVKGLWLSQVQDLGIFKLWSMTSEVASLLESELSTEVRETFAIDDVAEALLSYTKQLSGGKVHLIIGKEEQL